MKKVSSLANVLLFALIFELGSYYLVLLVSFDEWTIPIIGDFNYWLLLTHSGQALLVTTFVLAVWPHKRLPTERNIIRRTEKHEPTKQ